MWRAGLETVCHTGTAAGGGWICPEADRIRKRQSAAVGNRDSVWLCTGRVDCIFQSAGCSNGVYHWKESKIKNVLIREDVFYSNVSIIYKSSL